MEEYYPVIKVPYELTTIRNATPDVIQKPERTKINKPTRPLMPQEVWEKNSDKGIFWERDSIGDYIRISIVLSFLFLIVSFLVLILIRSDEPEVTLFIYISNGFAIWFLFFKKSNAEIQYERDIQLYKERLKEYELEVQNEKDAYQKRLKAHSDLYNFHHSKKLIGEHRKELLRIFTNNITKPTTKKNSVKRGVAESQFHKILRSYFGNNIKTDLALEIPNNDNKNKVQNWYYPDFCFYNRDTIAIDIEVDEPYVGVNGEPIHYLYSDDYRDEFFLDNDWIVIRFAEEQIVNEPINCCYVIAETIYEYTSDDNFLKKLGKAFPLGKVKRWTKDESHKLAFKRSRDKYLGKKFKEE